MCDCQDLFDLTSLQLLSKPVQNSLGVRGVETGRIRLQLSSVCFFFSKYFTVTNLETEKILRSVVNCVWDSGLALGRVELLGGL